MMGSGGRGVSIRPATSGRCRHRVPDSQRDHPAHRPHGNDTLSAPLRRKLKLLGSYGYCRRRGLPAPAELAAIGPHAVQDHRQLASDRDTGAGHAAAFGHGHAPRPQGRPPAAADQQAAKPASEVPSAPSSTAPSFPWLLWRNSRLSRFATAMPSARPGTCATRWPINAYSASGGVSTSVMSMRTTCRVDGGRLAAAAVVRSTVVARAALRRCPAHLRTVPDLPAKPSGTSSRQSRAALWQPSTQRNSR
jgi:hypothetical protein